MGVLGGKRSFFSIFASKELEKSPRVFGIPSQECRIPSRVFQIPSQEFRIPSREFGIPSGEFRIPSGVCGIPSGVFAILAEVCGIPAEVSGFPAEVLVVSCFEFGSHEAMKDEACFLISWLPNSDATETRAERRVPPKTSGPTFLEPPAPNRL